MKRSRPLSKPAMLFAMLSISTLTACTTTTGIGAIDTACAAFNGISYSKADTALTVTEIRQFNAKYKALCGDPTKTP